MRTHFGCRKSSSRTAKGLRHYSRTSVANAAREKEIIPRRQSNALLQILLRSTARGTQGAAFARDEMETVLFAEISRQFPHLHKPMNH